jgi:hypothetical protein
MRHYSLIRVREILLLWLKTHNRAGGWLSSQTKSYRAADDLLLEALISPALLCWLSGSLCLRCDLSDRSQPLGELRAKLRRYNENRNRKTKETRKGVGFLLHS